MLPGTTPEQEAPGLTMIKKRFIGFVLLAVIFITAYILNDIYALSGDTEIRLGRYDFVIPAEYGTDGFMDLSARWFTSKFQSNKVAVFEIKASELKANISGYEVGQPGHARNIKGLIRVWNAQQMRDIKAPGRYENLWNGTGPYKNRQVIPYSNGQFYRVYRVPESPKVWTVLSQNPSAENPLPEHSFDFWLARCRLQSPPFKKAQTFTVCNSYLYDDDVVVEFYLTENNLRYLDEIRVFLMEKIGQWRRPVPI